MGIADLVPARALQDEPLRSSLLVARVAAVAVAIAVALALLALAVQWTMAVGVHALVVAPGGRMQQLRRWALPHDHLVLCRSENVNLVELAALDPLGEVKHGVDGLGERVGGAEIQA